MKLTSVILAGGLLSCVFFTSWGFAQEKQDHPLDLDGLRDPFASQIPPPPAAPVVPKMTPVVSDVPKPVNPVKPVVNPIPFVTPAPASRANPKASAVSLVVKGMVWNTNLPQAIINNQILKVGDEVQGMQIISIDRAGIELSNKGADANGVNVKIGVSNKK